MFWNILGESLIVIGIILAISFAVIQIQKD